jgi:hypothetical protein
MRLSGLNIRIANLWIQDCDNLDTLKLSHGDDKIVFIYLL